MSIPVIAFFNNKGGVGKTSMVYHLAWMFSERGFRVIAADLDPQCNLTASFLDEDRLEEVMSCDERPLTVFGAVQPLKRGTSDIYDVHVENIHDRLGLILGDMALSTFEDDLSEVWPKCLAGEERAFRITSAFWRLVQKAGEKREADMILLDLGPNLGAINRVALIASDFVVIPLGPDLFSLQGLRNLGPALRTWRDGWIKRLGENPIKELPLPRGTIQPIGYMVLRHSIRLDRPVKAFERWMAKMPSTYAEAVMQCDPVAGATVDNDPNCIAKLKDYRSLMPLAQEVRKPMFFLKAADGAIGAHTYAVNEAYKDFEIVANKIANKIGIKASSSPEMDSTMR
ncbi:MAG: AAA family ATPase [Pirellulaceae bacterium]|nr:AAA family ATPase [Pirellulaceae bacterium]